MKKNIDQIRVDGPIPSTKADKGTEKEMAAWKRAKAAYRTDILDSHIKNLTQERLQREKFARDIIKVVWIWLVFVGIVIIINGFSFSFWGNSFALKLSDDVLMVLIGSTTANIVGLAVIVVKWLFRDNAGAIEPLVQMQD